MIDEIADKFKIEMQSQKFDGVYGKGEIFNETCLLVKPQTYMNRSGKCVAGFANFYKIPSKSWIVIHDDVDVPSGLVKARVGGSSGGNNGIKSIIKDTGLEDFHRIKLGVGKPGPDDFPKDIADWVLAPMRDDELLALQKQMLEDTLVRLRGIFQATQD